MTQLNSKSIHAILQEALDKDGNFLKEIVRRIIQQLMEEERSQQVGVLSHRGIKSKERPIETATSPVPFNTQSR